VYNLFDRLMRLRCGRERLTTARAWQRAPWFAEAHLANTLTLLNAKFSTGCPAGLMREIGSI
jgi:hypothetical protein